jgi:asparagine synthetase A
MAFNFFPTNYKPLYDQTRTRGYISRYHKLLSEAIVKNFNAIHIDVPFVSNVVDSWNAYTSGMRLITFDNKHTSEVNEVMYDIGNYLHHIIQSTITNSDSSIYAYAPLINRDANEELGHSIVTQNFYIELKFIDQENVKQQILPTIKNVIGIIDQINKDISFVDIGKMLYSHQMMNYVSIDEIAKLYPLLSLRAGVNQYVATNGPTAVQGLYKTLSNGKQLAKGLPTCDDYELSTVLFVLNKTTNSVMPIVKVSPRPNVELIKKQLILDLPNALQEQIYNKTLFDESKGSSQTMGIQIFFSNLMLINLHKAHLSEVVHSA